MNNSNVMNCKNFFNNFPFNIGVHQEGAKRELKEESGLDFEPTSLICVESFPNAFHAWIRFTYTGTVVGESVCCYCFVFLFRYLGTFDQQLSIGEQLLILCWQDMKVTPLSLTDLSPAMLHVCGTSTRLHQGCHIS